MAARLAPHGESAGAITFRIDDMLAVGGRPILDAFVMLLHRNRWFGVSEDHALPALLADSSNERVSAPAPSHALFLERVTYPSELYLAAP